jgi:hypothetical protein
MHYPLNAKDRSEFLKWCGDRFDEWYSRAHGAWATQEGDPDASRWRSVELFEDDWHPDGVMAAARQRAWVKVHDLIDAVAEQVRLEVTEELLGSEFALGDGTMVTWGDATVADHEQRIRLLEANAVGNVQTAARHRAAIVMINDGNVKTLAEVAIAEAAA